MLQMRTALWECGRRCVVVGGSWLVLLFILPLLPVEPGSKFGAVLAVFGVPTGYVLSMKGAVPPARLYLSSAIPLLAVIVYDFTYLIPPTWVVDSLGWVALGAAAATAFILLYCAPLGTRASTRVNRSWSMILAVLWWVLWGFAGSAAVPIPHGVGDTEISCRRNLKMIGVALAHYARSTGNEAWDVSALVQAGFLDEGNAHCPLGTRYERLVLREVHVSPGHSYITGCANHPPRILMLRRDGRLFVFEQSARWENKRIGPRPPWYPLPQRIPIVPATE